MNVSKAFLKDFAYLAKRYGWTPADIEDIKAQTRADPESMQYLEKIDAMPMRYTIK